MIRIASIAVGLGMAMLPSMRAEPPTWNPATAAASMDARARDWAAFPSAARGTGDSKSTCVSCHSVLHYALARPALRKSGPVAAATTSETAIRTNIEKRVAAWIELDTPPFRLNYDFDERKKLESRGTESVLNAVILAFDDAADGRKSPADSTRQAFAHLWATQRKDGTDKGSWDWLDFGLEPWESPKARYVGAALAAVAVGTAPGYLDASIDADVQLLRDYLRRGFAKQSLHNQAWALWAHAILGDILAAEDRTRAVGQLLAAQRDDGGWNLAALGNYKRSDGTTADTGSDGYATGLVAFTLQAAGAAKTDAKIAKGLNWLRTHQEPTGEWRTRSVNKKRDGTTHVGRFMSDAATGFAVLALSR